MGIYDVGLSSAHVDSSNNLLGIFFKPLQELMILENILALLAVLMSNGFVGLIVITFYVGQFFLSYYLYKCLGRFV